MKKPDFIIVGAMRAGTTSLFRYLIQHPNIEGPKNGHKELHFFDNMQPGNNWGKGLRWYCYQFSEDPNLVTGEASPTYMHSPFAAKRIREFCPDTKIIFLLRNPIERSFSQYLHCVHPNKNRDTAKTFTQALDLEPERLHAEYDKYMNQSAETWAYSYHSYVHRSMYSQQVKRFLDIFPREQLLFIKSENLFEKSKDTTNDVFRFLGVDEIDIGHYEHFHKEDMNIKMTQQERDRLRETFKSDVNLLEILLDKKFNWL